MLGGGIHGEGLHLEDTCPLAKRVAATLIPKLIKRFPGQPPTSAVRVFDTKLPVDVRLTSAMMLANLGQFDIVVGAWECLSMSRRKRMGGIEDVKGTCFFDSVCCLNYLQE